MALRKVTEIPKIPKARVKTIDSQLDATPAKKKSEIEYRVVAFYNYDVLQKKQFYVVSLSTIKEFSQLNYELSVDVRKNKDSIDISILGLNTKQSYLVKPSAAVTDLFFEELFGNFKINVIKQDGSINTGIYYFNVFKKELRLVEEILPKKKFNRKFCKFEVDNNLNTFLEV